MKKILVLLAVFTAVWCASCSNEDDNDLQNVEEGKGGEGVITMVVDVERDKEGINPDYMTFCIHSFKEGESITVDWGDDWVEEFKTIATDESEIGSGYSYWTDDLKHIYAKQKSYTITIKGNIKGLEYESNDYYAKLTSLDASRCPALKYLYCTENKLTSLDVSGCTALEELDCSSNELISLDVSKCTKLTYLDCRSNELTSSLDVSKCMALKELKCANNNLTSLNASGCTALEELDCSYNELTSLDVSKCTKLTVLDCRVNELTAEALNKIFTDLPKGNYGYIQIYGNPGTETCDKSIAEKKYWNVRDYYWSY